MSPTDTAGMQVDEALSALERDLLAEGGPRISTMRNYNFAIVPYRPSDELALRRKVRALADRLRASGFRVLAISLQRLLLERLRSLGPEVLSAILAETMTGVQSLIASTWGPNVLRSPFKGAGGKGGSGGQQVAEDVVGVLQYEFVDWRERKPANDILADLRVAMTGIPGVDVEVQVPQAGPSSRAEAP